MAETHVPTMEELLTLKQQVAEEIARVRAGMQYDDSEMERKYRALRIARCTMNLQTLETEVSHAKNGIPPSYTECILFTNFCNTKESVAPESTKAITRSPFSTHGVCKHAT
jgi:hypothetical protein